jgi:4-amino-4-deoxy-L-arabinose transferase-like glycosyltransferase
MTRVLHSKLGLIAALCVFALLVAWGWVGFIASDDWTFAVGGYGWIEDFPFVGGHGTIRYPITIPIALSFLTLGENEFALALPSLIYIFGFLTLTWVIVRRAADGWIAFGALAALITCPLLVIQSSIASVDIVEMFYLFSSVYLFWHCVEHGPDAKRLFFAGALAGLGFLTRETAIFIALFYAIYFAIGYRFHRGHYLWITAGFIAVWLVEVIYLWIMTGDPLYRITIALNHDSTIDRSIDLAGNMIVHPVIDPLLVLLANQEFMALFFVAIPLGGWLYFSRSIAPKLQRLARIVATLGLVWFVTAGAAQTLLPLNPRYFIVTAAAACILTGIALALLWQRSGKRWLVLLVALFLLSTNLLGIYVENKDFVFGERQLAAVAVERPNEKLYTDPMTRYRADMLLRWEAAQPRVLAEPPAAGTLYFHNPKWADNANFMMTADQIPAFKAQPGWQVIGSWEPQPPLITKAIEASGLSAIIPQGIWYKLRYRHPRVTLYRVRWLPHACAMRPTPLSAAAICSIKAPEGTRPTSIFGG